MSYQQYATNNMSRMREQQAPNYQQHVQHQNYVIPASQQPLNYTPVNGYSQTYHSSSMYNPTQSMLYQGQQVYHQQQYETAMPPVSSMISPPIELPLKYMPPWRKNRIQPFVLPSIEAKTQSLAMSSFMMNEPKPDERYTETPIALPLECHLGPGTPSPSLPSRSPSGTPPLIDPSAFMRLAFEEELSLDKRTGNTKKRKWSIDEVKTPVKRYRRTKAELAAAKRDEQLRQLRPCTIIVDTIDLIDSSVTRFRKYSSTLYNKSVMKPNTCRVPRMKLVPNEFTKVVNMGFMKTTNGIALSCMVDHCRFKSYRPIDFRKHLDTWHTDQSSSSKCQLCNETLVGNLELELKHTIEHIRSTRNMPCSPILYSKITPTPLLMKKLKKEPKEEPQSDVESEVESDYDSQAETDPESSADTDQESLAETEILSEDECDKAAETEVAAEVETPFELPLIDEETPESSSKAGNVLIKESDINYDAVDECLAEIENIFAPNSVCPESQDDPDFIPPNSEPESEDEVAIPSDDESKEASSEYEDSSENEELLPGSLLFSRLRRRRKKSCEKPTAPAEDSSEMEPIRKLRIARKDSASSSESSVSSANTDELGSENQILTRRKSLALEKDLIVQCLNNKKCDPEASIVEPQTVKSKQGRKKKVKFADAEQTEKCEPATSGKVTIASAEINEDKTSLSNTQNATDKTGDMKEEKPSVDKKLEGFDFFTRIPASIVERIKLAKMSSVKSENEDESPTYDAPSQQSKNVAEEANKTEFSTSVDNSTECGIDDTPAHAVQEAIHEKEVQVVALAVPPMTTQQKFQIQEDFLFKPKKIRPTARKRTQTVAGKKQRKVWCPEECVIKMKLIPAAELKLLIESSSQYGSKVDPLAVEINSSDLMNISIVSDLGLKEIEYEEKLDESHGEPPIPSVDFPALMKSTPKKSSHRNEHCEEEEVFYDSQDFVEPAAIPTDPLFEEVITESVTSEPLTNLAELYPWIDDDIVEKWSKTQSHAKALLDTKCLFSTFKCMSIECSYFSTSLVDFKKHLRKHTSDKYFLCSFCLCDETDPGDLIAHIKEFHRQDRYQCSKCMYRSCEKFYCDSHRKKFHPNQQVSIFKSPIQKCFLAHRNDAFEAEKLKLDEKIKPIQCKFCSKSFYIALNFLRHLEWEDQSTTNRDTKRLVHIEIDEILKGLQLDMYKYGDYQCTYCEDAFRTPELMKDHLAVCHPHKYGFTCVRRTELVKITNPNNDEPKYKDFIDLVNKNIDKAIRIQSYRGLKEALTGEVVITPKAASTKAMFQISEVKTITFDQL